MLPRVQRSLLPACALLLALPAVGHAAKPAATPKVKSVKPMKLRVGDNLTIRGSGFLKGKGKTTVVFKRDGARAVFVKADKATTSTLTVKVPLKLLSYFRTQKGVVVATRFRLRVLGKRFAAGYTATKLSPVIDGPLVHAPTSPTVPGGSTPGGSTPAAPANCDGDAQPDSVDTDDDNDGLLDLVETRIGTQTCNSDTDGDGVPDGFEYVSAQTLNGTDVPHPDKAERPDPRDGTDANTDFDGDGLSQLTEYKFWIVTGRPATYNYNDGTQYSAGNLRVAGWRDDQRDADQDGLSNRVENVAPLVSTGSPEWWVAIYDGTNAVKETEYYGQQFVHLSPFDPDVDGDGIKDGLDDQDHDGYANWFEVSRPSDWACTYVSDAHPLGSGNDPSGACAGITHDQVLARTQPFNPCKPIESDLCHVAYPAGYYQAGEDWHSPVVPGDPGTTPPPDSSMPVLHQ